MDKSNSCLKMKEKNSNKQKKNINMILIMKEKCVLSFRTNLSSLKINLAENKLPSLNLSLK